VIWVPQGDAADTTRDPATFDAMRGFCPSVALSRSMM
jgi:hypothetical protein